MQPENNWISLATTNPLLVSYQLIINLAKAQSIKIGRLGQFEFPAGQYLYTGSARCNLIARVQRHLSQNKKLRWHIDFLLASEVTQVVDVRLSTQSECDWNQQSGGIILVSGFGASDCKAKCGSHLKYLGECG